MRFLTRHSLWLTLLPISVTASGETVLSNGDFETDVAPADSWPDDWTTWARANTTATYTWDDQVYYASPPEETGHSAKLQVTGVSDQAEGKALWMSILPGVEPSGVYRITLQVKTQDLITPPVFVVRWRYDNDAGGVSWNETQFTETFGRAGTADWTTYTITTTAPAVEADYLVILLEQRPHADQLGGTIWFDALTLEEFAGGFKQIEFTAKPVAYVSPDRPTQQSVTSFIHQNTGDPSGELVVELPPGVDLLARYKGSALPDPDEVVHPSGIYRRWVIPYSAVTTYYAFENLYLGTTWEVGHEAEMYLHARWDGGEQEPVPVLLRSVASPSAPRLQRLRTGGTDWLNLNMAQRWPDLMTTLRDVGARAFSMVNAFYLTDYLDEVALLYQQAAAVGLEGTAIYVPFTDRNWGTNFTDEEVGRDYLGGAKSYMCPALRTGNYLTELAFLARAGAGGIRWVFYDWEPGPDGVFCGDAIARFHAAYPQYADEDPALFIVDSIHDSRDLAFDEFQSTLGTELWTDVHRTMAAALQVAGVEGGPILAQWRALPGRRYTKYTEFDHLYPQVFRAAMPVIYPLYSVDDPGKIGPLVRQTLLGVLALASPNTFANPGLESGGGPWPDGITVDATAGLRWEELTLAPGRADHGVRALRIDLPGDRYAFEIPAVQGGERILVAANIAIQGNDARACIEVEWYREAELLDRSPVECMADAQFVRLPLLDRVPETATRGRVILSGAGSNGSVWFDDVMVNRPNLLPNPGLEWHNPLATDYSSWGEMDAVVWSDLQAFRGSRSAAVELNAASVAGTGIATTIASVIPGAPYQLSAVLRAAGTTGGTALLAIDWYDDALALIRTAVEEFADVECLDWQELTLAAEAPTTAASATVRIGMTGAVRGTLSIDDLDARIDGPYVAPWMSAGWGNYEFPSRIVLEEILEAYLGGAQALAGYPASGWDGYDIYFWGRSAAMLAPFEDFIADGRPILARDLHSDVDTVKVIGMERDGEALFLVSAYEETPVSATVTYATDFPGTLHRIDIDGNITPVVDCQSSCILPVTIEPLPESAPRVQLYHFARTRQQLNCTAEVDAGLVDAEVVDTGSMDTGVVDAETVDAEIMDAAVGDSNSVDAAVVDAFALDTRIPDATSRSDGHDAGVADVAGVLPSDAGCRCRTSGEAAPVSWVMLMIAAALLRRRRIRTDCDQSVKVLASFLPSAISR